MNKLQKTVIELVQTTPLLKTDAERREWTENIIPGLTKKDLEEAKMVLLQAKKAEETYLAKKVKILKEKYAKVKVLWGKVKKTMAEAKEAKNKVKEDKALQNIEAELAKI